MKIKKRLNYLSPRPFFWKSFSGPLFPEAVQLDKERSVPRRPPPFFRRTRGRSNVGGPLLGQRFARCDSASAGETELRAEAGTADAQGEDRPPRASPSVCVVSWGPHHCAVPCKICARNLCFTLPPPSSRVGGLRGYPSLLLCAGPRQAAIAASFRAQVQYCCNFSGKKELRAGGWEGERARGRLRGEKGNPSNKRVFVLYFNSPLVTRGADCSRAGPASLHRTQGRTVDDPGGSIRSPRCAGPEGEETFLGQKRHRS